MFFSVFVRCVLFLTPFAAAAVLWIPTQLTPIDSFPAIKNRGGEKETLGHLSLDPLKMKQNTIFSRKRFFI